MTDPPPANSSQHGQRWLCVTPVDRFFCVNLVLFLFMACSVYYHRFLNYMGQGRVAEFFFYATVLTGVIALAWLAFRRIRFPGWLLCLLQVGIIIHFAGGFVHWDGLRLYDHFFFGLRYDKFVHFFNTIILAVLVRELMRASNVRLDALMLLFLLLVVLGLGACCEIIEYVVVRTIPHNGVGDYDNNMQDLIANAAGGLTFTIGHVVSERLVRGKVVHEPA